MQANDLIQWVAGRTEAMEHAIVDGVEKFLTKRRIGKRYANVVHDLRESQNESFLLGRGEDLCYDRFTCGAVYALFYQGRRINTSLTVAAEFVCTAINENKPIEIFDLGAGAGAVHVAIAMCVEAAYTLDPAAKPAVRVINVDSSPIMLDFALNYLIPAFRQRFPAGFGHVVAEYECASWTNEQKIHLHNPYVVASYVFDSSDNVEAVKETFTEIVERFAPQRVVLTTSWRKRELVNAFAREESLGGLYHPVQLPGNSRLPLRGAMTILGQYRQRLNARYGTNFYNKDKVVWDEISFYGVRFDRKETTLFNQALLTDEPLQADLFQRRIRIRRDLVLSTTQKKAAEPDGRPTVLMGAAGSGKSVVITERIRNIVEAADYDPSLRMLLTTFNKELVTYLIGWLKDLLDEQRCEFIKRRWNGGFKFAGSNQENIHVFNFDQLPPRFGKIRTNIIVDEREIFPRLELAVNRVLGKRGIDRDDFSVILHPEFLYLEYVRTIYGQLYLTGEQYATGRRSGRGVPVLGHNSREREIIWDCIKEFFAILKFGADGFVPADTLYTRRHRLYRALVNKEIEPFTHVFVDEFQDCTHADYQIFYGLARDNNEVLLAGDYAQAVHLGATVQAPRADETFQEGKPKMGNRNNHTLEGSYRLPFRITQCVKPLSEHINRKRADLDVNIINPYRGAPPGARPIVVYAGSEEEMAEKLARIHDHYQIFNFERFGYDGRRQITILEKDAGLCNALNTKYGEIALTDTILRLKGMEKDCIVWSSRIPVQTEGDEDYFVYTILTRTRSILIVALFDDTPARYRHLVSLFPENRRMLWDKETKEHYARQIQPVADEPSIAV